MWYGADYSARELSNAELDDFGIYDLRFLVRYIGYPTNPKCISYYPGAYARHTADNRVVLLVHEHDINDPSGGFAAGVSHATLARDDARRIGYPDTGVIFFAADRNPSGASDATVAAYLDGAASVIGHDRVGAYGFRDFLRAARNGNHARWTWLAGASPTDQEVHDLGINLYQWNNGRIYPGGLECDLNWAYTNPADMLGTPGPAPVAQKGLDMVDTGSLATGANKRWHRPVEVGGNSMVISKLWLAISCGWEPMDYQLIIRAGATYPVPAAGWPGTGTVKTDERAWFEIPSGADSVSLITSCPDDAAPGYSFTYQPK